MTRAMHNVASAGSLEAKDLEHLLHPTTNLKLHHEKGPTISMKGKGVYLWDNKGKQYLEGMAGLWCTALGYGEEELARTAREQMEKLCYSQLFGSRSNEPSILLAEKLKSMMPMDAGRVFFGLSGSDANDTQVKLMRYYHNVAGAERLPAPGGRAVPALRRRQRVTMGEFAFCRGDLYAADECFLTGSLSGVKPVKSVDRRSIGTGVAGPVTLRLQELYISAMYGRLPKYRHWLTPVPVRAQSTFRSEYNAKRYDNSRVAQRRTQGTGQGPLPSSWRLAEQA